MARTPLFVHAQPLRIRHRSSTIVCRTRRARHGTISLATESGGNVDSKDDANSSSAWAAWQQARSKPEDEALQAPQRDPNSETDFWRGVAQELVPDAPTHTRASNQRAVWSEARDVTAGVDQMKTQLEEELNTFSKDKALDDYREAARELTGSQLELIDQVVGSSTSSPDIDEPAAYDFDAAWNAKDSVPNDGWVGRDETIIEPVSPPDYTPSSDTLPTPPTGGPTYGSDAAVDPSEADAWRRSAGFQTRDPQAETDFWRDTAKELVPDTPSNIPTPIEGLESPDAVEFEASPVPESDSATFAAYHAADKRWNESIGSDASAPAYTDGSKPWGATSDNKSSDWGGKDWDNASDNARWRAWGAVSAPRRTPREPSRGGVLGDETDMFMSFARDLGGDGDAEEEVVSKTPKAKKPGTQPQEDLGDSINFWSTAAKEITDALPDDASAMNTTDEGSSKA